MLCSAPDSSVVGSWDRVGEPDKGGVGREVSPRHRAPALRVAAVTQSWSAVETAGGLQAGRAVVSLRC